MQSVRTVVLCWFCRQFGLLSVIKYECGVVSCHSGIKKVVILSVNDVQAVLHEIFLSRYYRLLANFCQQVHYRDYVLDTGKFRCTVLVSVIRSYGNDYFQSYRVLQC